MKSERLDLDRTPSEEDDCIQIRWPHNQPLLSNGNTSTTSSSITPPPTNKRTIRTNPRYSMGGDARKAETTIDSRRTGGSEETSDRCCCSCLSIYMGAYIIAFIELLFIVYNLVLALWNYKKTGDDYAFSFILSLFCMALALVAIVLLVIGIRRTSANFLVPHLLMQLAIIVSWTLIAGYLVLLMIGGTSVKINAIIYEDSARGRAGLALVNRYEPIKSRVHIRGLNVILVALLGITVALVALQVWFFAVVRRCFSLLRRSAIDKALSGAVDRQMTLDRV